MTNKLSPNLTIITPSYNLGSYLERAIQSVLNQDYSDYEYWVIDGGSTDQTIQILKKYSSNPKYKAKFHWLSEPDKGQTHAINKGLHLAKGDWFAWLNADDYYEPNTFKTVMQTAQKNPDVALIYGNCLTHGELATLNKPPKYVDFKTLQDGNVIFGPAAFFNTHAIAKVGEFDEDLELWMDYDMFERLAKRYRFFYLDRLLAHFSNRPNQKSAQDLSRLQNEAKYVNFKNTYPILKYYYKIRFHI